MNNLLRISSVSFVLYCAFMSCSSFSAVEKVTLKITGIGQNGVLNSAYHKTAYNFEKRHPNVKVLVQLKSDASFKKKLNHILSKESDFDIIILHAGERLKEAINLKQITPITELWNKQAFNQNFTVPMKNAVSYKNNVYAVPFSYYAWGFYYKKSFFKSLLLTPPTHWNDFKSTLSIIKKNNIAPLFIGTKNPWPIGAWFEYINLRINGLDFHNQFVNGEINAKSPEIYNVLSHLKELIEQRYFISKHHDQTIANGVASLVRQQTGMVLAGGSFENSLPEHLAKDIGFFPFPKINESVSKIQVAPLDVMTISAFSQNKKWAEKFLTYIAQADVQTLHNLSVNQLPANIDSTTTHKGTPKETLALLREADGLTLFYDREVEKKYGLEHLKILKNFLDNPDIEQIQLQMERARQDYLVRILNKKTL